MESSRYYHDSSEVLNAVLRAQAADRLSGLQFVFLSFNLHELNGPHAENGHLMVVNPALMSRAQCLSVLSFFYVTSFGMS